MSDAPLIDGGDGRIFFPGDRAGTVRLAAVGPTGLLPAFKATPVTGWRLLGAAAGTDNGTLELSFVPRAAALTVAVEFRDDAGSLVATIDRTLIAGPPDPEATAAAGTMALSVLGPLDKTETQLLPLDSRPLDPEFPALPSATPPQIVESAPVPSSVVTLDWVEQASATPIIDRRLRIESAPVNLAAGCGTWQTIDEREIELAAPLPGQRLVGPNVGTDATVAGVAVGSTAWSATLAAPDGSLPAQRSDFAQFPWEFESQRTGWQVGRLTVPLAGGGCVRFGLVVGDSLGRTAVLDWPVAAPGRLALGGRVLPVYDGRLNLYRGAAFASQQHYTWCVGAVGQMMVNLISGQASDAGSQRYFMAWAETHDWIDHRIWGGSDDEGLRSLLERFSGIGYEKVWAPDVASATRLAAVRMRLTGAPAEITVMDGKHAWVLHGFESSSDPLLDSQASISAVYVSGPLWPRAPQSGKFDPPPDTRLTPSGLYGYLSPSGRGGPWKVVVPVPGSRGWAAPQPSSLAEIGLRWWPVNLFTELRTLPDLRTVDTSPTTSPSPSLGPTASPDPSAGSTGSPGSSPTPVPTDSPTAGPTASPTIAPTAAPTPDPTAAPTPDATAAPTPDPTAAPTP